MTQFQICYTVFGAKPDSHPALQDSVGLPGRSALPPASLEEAKRRTIATPQPC